MFELMASTICTVHFMFHDFETLRNNYVIIFLSIGLITVTLSLFDFFISAKLNMFLMFLYASLFMISFLSAIHWVSIANIDEVEKMSPYVLMGYLFLFIGFIIFKTNKTHK